MDSTNQIRYWLIMTRYLLLFGFAADSLVYIGAIVFLVLLWQSLMISYCMIIISFAMILIIILALFSLKKMTIACFSKTTVNTKTIMDMVSNPYSRYAVVLIWLQVIGGAYLYQHAFGWHIKLLLLLGLPIMLKIFLGGVYETFFLRGQFRGNSGIHYSNSE